MPRIQISISKEREHHEAAAQALSKHLDGWGIPHAFIGGFAWSVLGSERPTEMSTHPYSRSQTLKSAYLSDPRIYDIDILIDNQDIEELRKMVVEADGRFALVNNLQFYFVTQHSDGNISPEDLVLNSTNNVVVETLRTGQMGLPRSITSTYKARETAAQGLKKASSDREDIRYIIPWLSQRGLRIGFNDYVGKTKAELLPMVRMYHDHYIQDKDHITCLRSIMPDDWDDMLALPARKAEDDTPP
ncbi:hypothetical protein LXA43DRAFT_447237 [Ganoderma leucocontextum]|nr:hypothetical protein LXA43DRAFT_447237 [Ganoderma leucocontextum]